MKRIRIVALCLVAVFAMTAVVTSSASATSFGRCVKKAKAEGSGFSDPGCTKAVTGATAKYEWKGGVVNGKFNSVMKAGTTATLESVGKPPLKVTCTAESGPGEIANEKEVANVKPTFNGCSSSGFKCASAGAAEGEIKTKPLGGVLGIEKVGTTPPINNKLALELHAEPAGEIVSFECSGLSVKTTGALLHPVTTNKMQTKGLEKFLAAKGEQKPDKFAGGTLDERTLETSTNGGKLEEAGQTITAEVTYEEVGGIEASSVN